MITFNVEQGTREWHEARAGKITASMFAEVRKKMKSGARKGMHSAAAEDYAFKLALERLSGRVLAGDEFETYAMRRGREFEEQARLLHEQRRGTLIQQVGFACDDTETYGASADGLIDDDGVAEYKCFLAPAKLRRILGEGDLSDAMDQMQGSLWISGRAYCDFGLYCPELEPIGKDLTVITVERNDAYIEELSEDLRGFNRVVEGYINQLQEPGEAAPEMPAAEMEVQF